MFVIKVLNHVTIINDVILRNLTCNLIRIVPIWLNYIINGYKF